MEKPDEVIRESISSWVSSTVPAEAMPRFRLLLVLVVGGSCSSVGQDSSALMLSSSMVLVTGPESSECQSRGPRFIQTPAGLRQWWIVSMYLTRLGAVSMKKTVAKAS